MTFDKLKGELAYIAGPMTGRADWNIEAFAECERVLREAGAARVFNPATIDSIERYESADDYDRDRFGDEDVPEPEPDPACGDCDKWTRCNIKGHEGIGWCSKWDEFFEEDDESCGDD